MLTVSLHGIQIHAAVGMFPQELVTGNDFETDIDLKLETNDNVPWPYVDYTLLEETVVSAFAIEATTMEQVLKRIYTQLKREVSNAQNITIKIRKMNLNMGKYIDYAQITYED